MIRSQTRASPIRRGAIPRACRRRPGRGGVGGTGAALAYETGVEVQSRSQWQYARRRFMRHRLAVVCLVLLSASSSRARSLPGSHPMPTTRSTSRTQARRPTLDGHHVFGDRSARPRLLQPRHLRHPHVGEVALIVAILVDADRRRSSAPSPGYYSGTVDNVLMRFTDLILTLPGLAVLLTAAALLGHGSPLPRRRHHRAYLLDVPRPHRPRNVPLPP